MSKEDGVDSMLRTDAFLGKHSREEIMSQPAFWGRCLDELENSGRAIALKKAFADVREWLFVGCGSSYYVALSAAATWSLVAKQRARAVPASELLLFPDILEAGSERTAAAMISRSGTTSETVRAAERLNGRKDSKPLAVTGVPGSLMEQVCGTSLGLLPCDERSTVMTRSFSSMLLGLQYLAASWGNNKELLGGLRRLPKLAEPILPNVEHRIRGFVEEREFADYVCLGQGPLYGIACETALKITEMSVSYAQSFHTLEFRHGPKSIVGPEILVIVLLSERGYDVEVDVLEEVKALGGTTLTIANRADARARAASDLLIEFGFDLPELATVVPFVFAGQLVGLHTGTKKSLDPDSPRHLSRVVMLK